MQQQQLVVALAAEDAAGVQALRLLTERGHRVVAVLTTEAGSTKRGTVAAVAGSLKVPARPASEVRDAALGRWLRAQRVDLLLNVHSLHIINSEVLEAPRLGAFNLHPGPLPERAGLNSPSWALYEGDRTHGVSLHRMTSGIDEGSIAFFEGFPVAPDETALAVLTQCVRRGLKLIERLLDLAERGEPIPAHAQDLSRRRWFGAGPPNEGCLDWGDSARRVIDFVRACDYRPFPSPWGFPRCSWRGSELAIVAARPAPGRANASPGTVTSIRGDEIIVAAGVGLVRVDRIDIGGRQLAPAAVVQSGDKLVPLARKPRRRRTEVVDD